MFFDGSKTQCNKKQQKRILLRHFSNNCYQTNLIIVSQLEFNVSATSTHTCSESICKVLMSLLMGSRGKSSHINFNATFNSLIVFGFGHRLWYFSSIAPLTWLSISWSADRFRPSAAFTTFQRWSPIINAAAYFLTVGLLSFHCLSGQAAIRALAQRPCPWSVCICILFVIVTLPILIF